MNARESLAADRVADEAWEKAEQIKSPTDPAWEIANYLRCIAAELRAARVYANYLEGRNPAMRGGKDTPSRNDAQPEEFRS